MLVLSPSQSSKKLGDCSVLISPSTTDHTQLHMCRSRKICQSGSNFDMFFLVDEGEGVS